MLTMDTAIYDPVTCSLVIDQSDPVRLSFFWNRHLRLIVQFVESVIVTIMMIIGNRNQVENKQFPHQSTSHLHFLSRGRRFHHRHTRPLNVRPSIRPSISTGSCSHTLFIVLHMPSLRSRSSMNGRALHHLLRPQQLTIVYAQSS